MINTRACEVLGIAHPIVQAGMGGGSNPELVAAVSEAGGLGILACTWTEPAQIRAQIDDIRARTRKPFGVNFVLDQADPERIDVALDARVPVLSLFRGADPIDVVQKAHASGLVTMHQITTKEEARVSLAAGIDVLVVQGREGGGHMGPHPMWSLLPQVIAIAGDTPVLASGGLCDGRDLAAALAMGASGVHMGTRFLVTPESPISAEHKSRIIAAGDGDTVASKLWDLLWGSPWFGMQARGLRNSLTARWAGRENDLAISLQQARADLAVANANMDHANMILLAGEGSSRITSIDPAAEIVRSVVAEAEAALRKAASIVS
jgi:NAD(P)H-dependent flavin oxidoreductase YrpB (nitropropane dioxygenase family)